MAFVRLGRKGSISIEFILIVGIALIYINGVVWPIAESSSQAAVDVKAVADTKIATIKIANAINEAELSSGDMKKTIQLFLPENSEITCNAGASQLDYVIFVDYLQGWNPDTVHCIEDPPVDPTAFKCTSFIEIMGTPGSCPTIEGPVFSDLVVKKTAGSISVDWA